MTTTAGILPVAFRPRLHLRWTGWHTGMLVLAVAAAALTTWATSTASMSDYYASIALSMSRSWPNFFFGALDPAGTVTLDKIPGSFWIPALFIRLFGFSAWTVVLPNALAAVGAALLVAITVKRLLGPGAGILAGAVVATTPILVAVSRSNQPETFFVLGLAAAVWASVHAITRRSFGRLIGAGLFIALAFQTYMLEAWAVWPALAAAWLCTRGGFLGKLWRLAVAGAVSLAASVLWIVIVSLIPASARPYIGSTLENSAWEMVFGYNGLGRFGSATADTTAYRSFTPPFSGSPGVLRLFNEQLAGQIAWLLPTAIAAVVVLWMLRYARPVTVLVTVWLATFAVMFSVVAGMHQFYTAALAVPIALAVGLAFGAAWRARRTWPQVLLLATAAITALGIGISTGGYSVPIAVVQAVAAAGAIGMLVVRRRSQGGAEPDRGGAGRWLRVGTAALVGVGLLLTPLVWSIVTIAHPSSINPVAGGASEMAGFGGRGGAFAAAPGGAARGADSGFAGGMPQGAAPGGAAGGMPPGAQGGAGSGFAGGTAPGGQDGSGAGSAGGTASGGAPGGAASASGSQNATLIAYLRQNAGDARYLAATFGAQSAATLILASDGGSFLPIGGFNGGDPVPTLAVFQTLVADGQLRYVVLSGGGAGGQGGGPTGGGSGTVDVSTSAQIRTWVQANCTVPADSPSTSLYLCTTG
ncbi:ArnT family glycosyltransferase [Microbacterium sp. CJ88]|uniref:ArnT family glycosyltransferase n=1 Tax=Microbacterium sp. CJ88 TaxID=3445672 RepID=UPI003F6599C8